MILLVLIGPIDTSTSRGKFEALDGEGEVVVIGIVHHEPVIDGLLEALGGVALGYQGTGLTRVTALLDPGRLAERLIVGLDSIDNDPPLALRVDRPERRHVAHIRRTQIGLLVRGLESVHRVVCVGNDVLVEGGHGSVVVLNGVLDVVGGILIVLEAPSGLSVRQVLDAGRDRVGRLVETMTAVFGRVVRMAGVRSGRVRNRMRCSVSWSHRRTVRIAVSVSVGRVRGGSYAIGRDWGVRSVTRHRCDAMMRGVVPWSR